MKKVINYLFCLDENYNTQFLTTLFSLNKNSNHKFNVFVLHENIQSLEKLFDKNNMKFDLINKINFYEIDNKDIDFPNLENNHISKATYYRFFIEKYIPDIIETLIYLDCDIVCIKNPEEILNFYIDKLNNSEYMIAAYPEYIKNPDTQEVFGRLKLNSKTYFNAGVMIINYPKWKESNLMNNLLFTMDEIKEDIDFWDQDVLNKYFDGSYLELPNYLNFNLINEGDNQVKKLNRNVFFVHYSGSSKPWTIDGVRLFLSNYFQDYYFQLSNDRYYLTSSYRLGSLNQLIKILITFRIFSIKRPLLFLKSSMILIFKK